MSEHIIVERDRKVLLVRLNRPQALNALNTALARELVCVLEEADQDPGIGALVITGSEKAFAAGADIREMASRDFASVFGDDPFSEWDRFQSLRTPTIAAVAGYALGGGCELAMMCDIIIAAEDARFGQPEIRLGVMPGMGGTQRLARAIGKAKAVDLILTGRTMDAAEAERSGLVARVVPADRLIDEALEVAHAIAGHGRLATRMAKEAINRAFETSLAEGLAFEKRAFQSLFATDDQKEGMAAFIEKRPPRFTNS
ncbi:MAG: enoyl-CoA hydratase [bacterium]|nr:enoyl-CoA hydratase [bacterium]